jgi:hypothetical protein
MTADADSPHGIEPDTKDWTWVLERPCDECGFDPASISHHDVAAAIRRDAADWVRRLSGPAVRERSNPAVWSVLEYGCHVRDVHRMFDGRVRLMLAEDEPLFPNWDQDATAADDDYASQHAAVVTEELVQAAHRVADTYASVPADQWSRPGLRSNGSRFTVSTIAVYHLHDVVHHGWDVDSPPIGR